MNIEEEFRRALAKSECAVGYEPFGEEPVPELTLPVAFRVPKDHAADPLAVAEDAIQKLVGKRVCVYIPGTAFDATGTRHGHGGGWYDRFLAATPPKWLRVGFCTAQNFSATPLTREPWDQPVDWVLVRLQDGWDYIRTNAPLVQRVHSYTQGDVAS